mgnify:CR=1 FL=1
MNKLKPIMIIAVILIIAGMSLGLTYTKWSAETPISDADDDDRILLLVDPNGTADSNTIDREHFLLDWTGSANITTLGTIATGTWQGDVIDHERGGIEADISAIADGGILVGDGAGSMAVRASALTAGAAGYFTHELGGIEADISAIADGGILVGDGAGSMAIRASALTAGAAGFFKHELGGLEADVSAYGGLLKISGGSTSSVTDNSSNWNTETWSFAIADPNYYYTDIGMHYLCIDPNTSAALTINKVEGVCDADPTTELDVDLYFADTFIGKANATLIGAIDTVDGVSNITSFTDATVPANKAVYLSFGAQPDADIKVVTFKVIWSYD